MIYTKPGEAKNLAIPNQRELPEGTARSLVRAMGLSVDEFLALARK